MESEGDNPEEQDTDTVTKEDEEPSAKQNRSLWWNTENLPRQKKSMERMINSAVDGVFDNGYLGLGKDPMTQMTLANFLKSIFS